jgi:hypothetical protein
MPVKAKPYRHQTEAFKFVCERFGLTGKEGGQGEASQGPVQPVQQTIPKDRNKDS